MNLKDVSMNATVNDTIRPNNGGAEIFYNLPNGTLVRQNAASVSLADNSPEGRYRVRVCPPTGVCPTTVSVHWVATANQNAPTIYASKANAVVDIRDDSAGDD